MARKPSPDDLRKLKDKAAEAAAKGKLDKAADLYREAAQGDPRDLATRQKLAEILRRTGHIPEAIEAYRAVADRFGKDGLLIKAIAISKTILELDPQHVETQAALAELYSQKAKAEGSRPPPRTMMVAAMKAAGAPPPARPPPPRDPQESVVSLALGPTKAPEPESFEIDLDAEVPLETGADLAGAFPPPMFPPEPELEILPEPPVRVPPPPVRPPPAVRAYPPAVHAPPTVHAQAGFEAPVPSRPPPPVARPGAPMFAQIMSAAERAVEAGVEEDLLIRADPVDAEILGDEPLSFSAGGAVEVVEEPPIEPEPVELVVEFPEEAPPPEVPQPAAPAARPPAPRPPPPARAPAARPAPASPGMPRIPIFSDLGRDAFVELMQAMVLHRVAKGESVLREGEDGTSFYVVASGRLAVTRRDETQGGHIALAHLGSGEFFGEMALLSGTTRSATITAEEDAEVLEFRADVLLDIAGRHPHVAQSLRRFYRQRLLANAMAVSPVFRPFQRGERKLIMERFRAREVAEGEAVIREGEPSDGLYVVLEGAVDVVKTKDGQEVAVGHLREGDLFGEMSCLRKAPASATVVVRRPGTLLRLPRKEFDELVVTYPQILELVATLSEERAENLDAILSGCAEWTDDGLVLT
ncbi:MAG TPA: cyclic nucleotide-binding domain-containing protein [Anaeromyxobacter sp.]